MMYRVFYRRPHEQFKDCHKHDLWAEDKEDAAERVKSKHNQLGESVHIITVVCIDERTKRHKV